MKVSHLLQFVAAIALTSFVSGNTFGATDKAPNVILIMTDDQGYGDLGCHGNKEINTPALDRLYAESVRLTDYHVDPTCSPTRSALLTGRYSSRTGVWHTIMGRSMLHKDEVTMADVFAASGYRTAAFGKWHLGDNYPLRPQDRGFHEVLIHGGGGITQTPDFWNNDYFDDTYWHNGVTQKYQGYCTDVFFDGALSFIEQNKERPFFVYLPTNAAHGPFNVAKKYSQPYKDRGVPSPRAEFYGMLTNIDDNIARMRSKLSQWGLSENTIFIFTTDNGTAAGTRGGGFNAGMRGTKGSEYEGGHRVPFFIHWPKGNLTGGRNVDTLCAHIDVLPTLIELCQLKQPTKVDIDGTSLARLLRGDAKAIPIPGRTLFVHSQRIERPRKWRKSAVMTHRWRLINGQQLFDMQADAGQKKNVAADHPQVVEQLRGKYDSWWQHISARFDDYVRIELGSPQANPTLLTCHDWHTNNGPVPWNQGAIRRDQTANGFWAVDVVRAGEYEITLRSRPAHVNHPLNPGTARILIGPVDSKLPIKQGATAVTFRVPLKAGTAKLQTWFGEANGTTRGAYFVTVRRIE
jgi:arylsulfatase A-like enzyme